MFPFILCAVFSQDPVAVASITNRDGSAAPVQHNDGALILSAKKAIAGKGSKSITWEIEPEELHKRCESLRILDDDDSVNPCILIPYGNFPPSSLIKGTTGYGFWVRQYVSLNDTGDKAKIFIAVTSDLPPPIPDDDDVKPEPKPQPKPPVKETALYIAVFHQPTMSLKQSIVLSDQVFLNDLAKRGHTFVRFSANDKTELGLKLGKGITTYPTVAIFDMQNGQPVNGLATFTLPDSVEALDKEIRKYTSR